MKRHELHLITTGKQELHEVKAIAVQCSTQHIDALHLREKQRGAGELTAWYAELHTLLPGTAIYINDRLDAALAVQAPGVQLGFRSLSVPQARRILAPSQRIGCSVHSEDEAVAAAQAGADFVMFGHIFATASKPGTPPRGIAALAEVVQACPVPVIAIGGIEPHNVDTVLSTGCSGVAVLSAILLHPDPASQLARFHEALERTQHSPRRGYQ
ncbi:thiamine phosphate synthase [Paenibacillus xerothermodurans]|uniref:Thiamine-phosphate synthase n=1 Tax=Paenibacillus xerothermodurans TaxID=1977292 RepID=A0A2W1P1N0_PAEXE|nr:thiamine phosphate synthase [Paenibacillus xerothermodurans]PZE21018.1 thiamine phosphate synthase [Paenibacillus xerothermodurans]